MAEVWMTHAANSSDYSIPGDQGYTNPDGVFLAEVRSETPVWDGGTSEYIAEIYRPIESIRSTIVPIAVRYAINGANNQNVGYGQGTAGTTATVTNRMSFKYYAETEGSNDPAGITTPCTCDCSSFVSSCYVLAGLPVSAGWTTQAMYNMMRGIDEGFGAWSNYFTNVGIVSSYIVGDIILYFGRSTNLPIHVAIITQVGASNNPNATTTEQQQNLPQENPEPEIALRMWMGWVPFEAGGYTEWPEGETPPLTTSYSYAFKWTEARALYCAGGKNKVEAYGFPMYTAGSGFNTLVNYAATTEPYVTQFPDFANYVGISTDDQYNNRNFFIMLKTYATENESLLRQLETDVMYNTYYQPVRQAIIENCGWDPSEVGPYCMGAVASIAIRDGNNWTSVESIFSGWTDKPTEETFPQIAYARQGLKHWDGGRWNTTGLSDEGYANQYASHIAQLKAGSEVYQIGTGTATGSGTSTSGTSVNPGYGSEVYSGGVVSGGDVAGDPAARIGAWWYGLALFTDIIPYVGERRKRT